MCYMQGVDALLTIYNSVFGGSMYNGVKVSTVRSHPVAVTGSPNLLCRIL